MIQLSSFLTGDSTLSPFSKYKVDFESPFNCRDTTLSSFFNRDSTLSPFPSITLSYSSSKGRLWVVYLLSSNHGGRLWVAHPKGQLWMFICSKDMHVWMHGNFEFLFFEWMHVWINGNFEFLFLSEWKLWVFCFKWWIKLWVYDEWKYAWNFEWMVNETLSFQWWIMHETLIF